jgi:hypothetical protein
MAQITADFLVFLLALTAFSPVAEKVSRLVAICA